MPDKRTIDGRDICPLLTSQWSGSVPAFDFLYPDEKNHILGLRKGPWKLMTGITQQYQDEGTKFAASIKRPLLFQVEQDLSERIDRAAEHPDIVDSMRKELLEKERQIQTEGSFWNASGKIPEAEAKDKSGEEPTY